MHGGMVNSQKVIASICPSGLAVKESAYNAGDLGLIPWAGKIPWRREKLPTPVFWPGEFLGLQLKKEQ